MARHSVVTYGGKSPVELSFGRRPRGVIIIGGQDLEILIVPGGKWDKTTETLQKLATHVYLEARQREAILRDIVYRSQPTGIIQPR